MANNDIISATGIQGPAGPAPTGAQNLVLATPNGSSGLSSLRALVGADLPIATTSTFGGVKDIAAASTKFVSSIAGGVPALTQPAASDLSVAALANGITATTQSANDNSTKIATTAYVDTADALFALKTTTVNGHALSSNVTIAISDIAAGALANGMTATTQSPGDNSTKISTTAYTDSAITAAAVLTLQSSTTTTQSLTSGSNTYVSGSGLAVPSGGVAVGTVFTWRICLNKTSAGGTGQMSGIIYVGTHGTTADTAKVTQAFQAGTALGDTGWWDITCIVQGTLGASCQAQWVMRATNNNGATGFFGNQYKQCYQGTFTFDSTVSNLIFGIAFLAAPSSGSMVVTVDSVIADINLRAQAQAVVGTQAPFNNTSQIANTSYVDNSIFGMGQTGFFDDFVAAAGTAYTVSTQAALPSDTNWTLVPVVGGTHTITSLVPASNVNPGQLQITTAATTGDGLTMFKGAGVVSASTIYPYGRFDNIAGWEVDIVFKLSQTTNVCFRAGLLGTPTSDPAANGLYVEYDTANTGNTDTDFTWVTRSASSSTYSTTNAIAADTNFHHVRIRSTVAGTIGFTIDGGTETLMSASITTSSLIPTVQIVARSNGAVSYVIDAFAFRMATGRT